MTICSGPRCQTPCWMSWALAIAGIQSLLFGAWAVGWPTLWFEWSHMPPPQSLLFWQTIGLIIGAQGLGYLLAATNPIRHWALVLMGLVAKIVLPVAFLVALNKGALPSSGLWITLLHDVLWWIPFIAILWVTLQAHMGRPPSRENPYTIEEASIRYTLSNGQTLADAARDQTLVLVFLRHFGCAFTRRILHGLLSLEADCERHHAKLVLVHMMQHGQETKYLQADEAVSRIADPYCELYRAFGLGKGGFWELLGPMVWLKGFLAVAHSFALFRTCGTGPLAGDGLQMPGAFLFRDGKILAARPAKSAADLPDVEGLFQSSAA